MSPGLHQVVKAGFTRRKVGTIAGPELWRQTHGRITHFVSSMGTTGTIMGVSRYLKEQNPHVTIVGLQPADGASIAGALPGVMPSSRYFCCVAFHKPFVNRTIAIRIIAIPHQHSQQTGVSAQLHAPDRTAAAVNALSAHVMAYQQLSHRVFCETQASDDGQRSIFRRSLMQRVST